MVARTRRFKDYVLPADLLETFDSLVTNRSSSLEKAVNLAYKDCGRLVRALEKRLSSDKNEEKDTQTRRVGVTLPPRTIEQLNELEERTKLPVEHVMRLAMEAYADDRAEFRAQRGLDA